MSESWLRNLKGKILSSVPISGQLVLVLLGAACYFGTCLAARRPLTWPWALAPGLGLSVAIETWEIWDHYGASGFGSTSPIGVVGRHLTDVLWMNLVPMIVFLAATWWSSEPR